jgi:membrane protein
MIAALIARIEQGLFEPPDSIIGKPLWKVFCILRYPYALLRDIARGDLTLRAVSLVYTTLLSVVPLIALSFSLLKGLGYHEDLEPMLYNFLEPLGDKATELTGKVMEFVENIRTDVLTSFGLIVLLYTAISMVQKVEESFNFVWRVEQPRSFARRLSEYLSVTIVGPALIVMVLGLIAAMTNSSLVVALSRYRPFALLFTIFGSLTPYIIVTIVFTLMYAFIPNTKVQLRAALVGGLAAGIAWAAGGALFTSFVAGSSRTMVIYAGFAIVIFALVWAHVSWLILLLGAQLAFYVQNPQYLRPGRGEIQLNAGLRERLALSIMYLIVHDYCNAKQRWTINSLADHLELPGAALGPIVTALERGKLLLLADDDTWVPARDPDAIRLTDVLDVVRNDAAGPRLGRIRDIAPAVDAAKHAERALKESLGGKTVKDLLE